MFIITIDGLAASGKSSISKNLAKILNFQHIDAGMFFRAVAFYLIDQKVKDEDILEVLEKNPPKLVFEDGKTYLFDKDVTDLLKSVEVTNLASKLGAIELIKSHIYEIERSLVKNKNSIVSGRDTGKMVFPNADLKFFITASLEKRAQRRFLDYLNQDGSMPYEEILDNLSKRDKYDVENKSLIIPKDAIEIDNSNDDLVETIDYMLEIIRTKYKQKV